MTRQEIEVWVRKLVDSVLSGRANEDARVELKSQWPTPERAASRLAAHANAARSSEILWIIGVDEAAGILTDPAPIEKSNWLSALASFFDGYPPTLLVDVNMIIHDKSVVGLYFETEQGVPYVVKHHVTGSYAQHVVPWREGTRMRTARRHELLSVLVSKRSLSELAAELDFNIAAPQAAGSKTIFRQTAFERAMADGVINSLNADLKEKLIRAYIDIDKSNRIVDAAMKMPPLQDHYPGFAEKQAQEA